MEFSRIAEWPLGRSSRDWLPIPGTVGWIPGIHPLFPVTDQSLRQPVRETMTLPDIGGRISRKNGIVVGYSPIWRGAWNTVGIVVESRFSLDLLTQSSGTEWEWKGCYPFPWWDGCEWHRLLPKQEARFVFNAIKCVDLWNSDQEVADRMNILIAQEWGDANTIYSRRAPTWGLPVIAERDYDRHFVGGWRWYDVRETFDPSKLSA